jgi:hypothetical protein
MQICILLSGISPQMFIFVYGTFHLKVLLFYFHVALYLMGSCVYFSQNWLSIEIFLTCSYVHYKVVLPRQLTISW